MSNAEIVIIGGGMAGLCCARRLQQDGIPSFILEGSDSIGGRIRTDQSDGFLLDRGFQFLLTSYPEARNLLDFPSLDLHSFFPGTLIRLNDGFRRLADPWKSPLSTAQQLFSPVGSLMDKLRIAMLRRRVRFVAFTFVETTPTPLQLTALWPRVGERRKPSFKICMNEQPLRVRFNVTGTFQARRRKP